MNELTMAEGDEMTNQKESRLLTWEEWLNEKEGNIPFGRLDSLIQASMKAQYEYDRKEYGY